MPRSPHALEARVLKTTTLLLSLVATSAFAQKLAVGNEVLLTTKTPASAPRLTATAAMQYVAWHEAGSADRARGIYVSRLKDGKVLDAAGVFVTDADEFALSNNGENAVIIYYDRPSMLVRSTFVT